IGWTREVDVPRFYRDYAARRFGSEAAGIMADSLTQFSDSVDLGVSSLSPLNLSLALAFPGFGRSAEAELAECKETGAARRRWIEERIRALEPKADQAARALLLARAAAPRVGSTQFYSTYLFELDYVAARFDGILSLYRAHLLADSEPERAAELF